MPSDLFPTQLVGSWCKPQWLCDHDKVYDAEGTWWRVAPDHLDEAHDDAVRLAIVDQERAGLKSPHQPPRQGHRHRADHAGAASDR